MTLEYQLRILHEIFLALPQTNDKAVKEEVLKNAAEALIFSHSEKNAAKFVNAMKHKNAPLSALQKLVLKECSCGDNDADFDESMSTLDSGVREV